MNLLEEQQIKGIGFNTLRRFWGLLPQTNASQNTLDKLSSFLGYRSFLTYSKEKNQHQKWLTEARLQQLKHKDRLSRSDLKFIQKMCETQDSVYYIIAVFEHAVYFEKWDYLSDLFNPNYITLLNSPAEDVTEYAAKLAQLINIYLNHLPKPYFDRIIEPLIINYHFRYYMIYSCIDMTNINHRYGEIIKTIQPKAVHTEEQLFLALLNGLWSYLNTGQAPAVNFTNLDLDLLPKVLVGRYYGYQILQAKVSQNSVLEDEYWSEFKKRFEQAKSLDFKWFLVEIIHHLIIIKDFKKLKYLLEFSYEPVLDDIHLRSYFDVFIFNLIDVIISFQNVDFKRAKVIFNQIDTDVIERRLDRSYFLIFYHCVGYHLQQDKNLKLSHQKEYFDLAKKTQFKIFNQAYLENFLTATQHN
ncbi:hypothetical protein GCM10010831_05420 [Psychroflexus salis]|uniref:Uncharacterized protein n=1 Tax=Psychroflexus salis TaxID=1526574 RepID=A0A916ZNZ1_9FLAO|nr:hypothetical protein GCM10010831_05420 [Psychroflexus salis]